MNKESGKFGKVLENVVMDGPKVERPRNCGER